MVKEVLYSELIEPNRRAGSINVSQIPPNRRNGGSMKKYYQAALLAVALLSLVSLLFYRHEYNRLRYVLEVLNFYGKPGAKVTDPNCIDKNSTPGKIGPLFNSPIPSWQRLNDELFVYSAHRVKRNEIGAIAFGKIYEDLNMNCKVYFEGKTPVLGNFRHSIIEENSGYAGYRLICEYSGIAIPEGVSFFSKETGSDEEFPILSVKNSPDNLVTDEIALCVAPPMNRSISRTDMISFLNFHQIIGVRNFIVYDYGVPNRFMENLKDIIVTQGVNMSVSILPWNFPFVEISKDTMKGIIETDCVYRSFNQVEFSATLYWEEYLVSKYHRNLLELLKDFEKTLPNSERYLIDTSVFCTQQKDDKSSAPAAPIAFRKTDSVSSVSVQTRDVYISKPHKSLNLGTAEPNKANADLINLNHYRYCADSVNQISHTSDKAILKFANDMFDAPIYKEFITRRALSAK